MGGINPPASTIQLMKLTQTFTLELCKINQNFWHGHSEIERAVLIELETSDQAERHITNARTAFANAAFAAIEAQKTCMQALRYLESNGENTSDLSTYFIRQLPRLVAISGGMDSLRAKMVPCELRKNQKGTLQGGMLFEREQSSIRHESLHLVSSLTEFLGEHSQIVKCENSALDYTIH